ncbi:MAG: ergothioneine biosynthesis protein EgtB, partial [Deltaproteobacteria bacterium]
MEMERAERKRRSQQLAQRYRVIRKETEALAASLEVEDQVVQTMPDVSPTKWHRAHTTWYFETFVLGTADPDYRPVHPQYRYLFNSYYNAVGEQFPRPRRGHLSRPTVAEVGRYRDWVDRQILERLDRCAFSPEQLDVLELGLHHEQQHQELILTDIKHVFHCNPLSPAYSETTLPPPGGERVPLRWKTFEGGLYEIGYAGEGFHFDNEAPRHKVYLAPFSIASRLVTAGEYLEFIEAGGYRRPEFWLADGWERVCREGWEAPLYWSREGKVWWLFTLHGLRPLDPYEPVCHLSYYEAEAYATFAGARLPREAEWEVAAADLPIRGNFLEDRLLHPTASSSAKEGELLQCFGDA